LRDWGFVDKSALVLPIRDGPHLRDKLPLSGGRYLDLLQCICPHLARNVEAGMSAIRSAIGGYSRREMLTVSSSARDPKRSFARALCAVRLTVRWHRFAWTRNLARYIVPADILFLLPFPSLKRLVIL